VRGCHTKEDIIDNEVIIDIPLKCLITVEMGKETDVCLSFMCVIFLQNVLSYVLLCNFDN
jgi:hypothetical protein